MKTKKILTKVLSIALVCVMLVVVSVNEMGRVAYASEIENNNKNIVYQDGDITIYGYVDSRNNQILEQYSLGKLEQRNIIYYSQVGGIRREFYNDSNEKTRTLESELYKADMLYIDGEIKQNATVLIDTFIYKGTINYKATLDQYIYYGLNCSFAETITNSTYVIRSYLGTVIDLISILVFAGITLAFPAATFIEAVLQGAGIAVVSGVLQTALSTTVSSIKTTYKWELEDTTNTLHFKTVNLGRKDYINDSNYNTGYTYTDGYTPLDWGQQQIAVIFHDQMFGYYPWEVVSWN